MVRSNGYRDSVVRSNAYRDFNGTQERIQGFQWYAVTDIGISVVRSNGYRDSSGTQ
jgi:hypothetical protein